MQLRVIYIYNLFSHKAVDQIRLYAYKNIVNLLKKDDNLMEIFS